MINVSFDVGGPAIWVCQDVAESMGLHDGDILTKAEMDQLETYKQGEEWGYE